MTISFRPAVYEDIGFFFYLAQCPEIRAQSHSTACPRWSEHVAWYERQRPRGLFYVAEQENGNPVGTIRFEPAKYSTERGGAVLVSVALAPAYHGQGHGSWLIQQASRCAAWKYQQPIIAEIKESNRASIRAFQKAGYFWCGIEDGIHRFQYANW